MEGIMPLTRILTSKKMLFAYLQFMFWASFAIMPFDVVFMRERGLDTTSIGLILSVNSFIAIFGQPLWGFISDWIKSTKKVFMFGFAMTAAVYVILPFTHTALTIGIVMGLAIVFRSSTSSLLDNWIVASASEDDSINYGAIRMWGSIGFAILALIYGKMIDGRTVTLIYPVYFVLSALTILLCIFVKQGGSAAMKHITIRELKPKKLFSNYYYMIFIAFIFLLNIPNSPGQTFIPNLLENAGGTREQYGLMMSIKAFFEVPFFFFGRYLLRRLGPVKLLIIGACTYMIQQFLFASAASPGQVIFAQTLMGPAYSLFYLGLLHYVFDLAPGALKATAQTMASALGMGLAAIIGNYGGGLFIARFGLQEMYWVGGVSDIAAIILFLLSFLLGRRVVKGKIQDAAEEG